MKNGRPIDLGGPRDIWLTFRPSHDPRLDNVEPVSAWDVPREPAPPRPPLPPPILPPESDPRSLEYRERARATTLAQRARATTLIERDAG